MKLLIIHFLCPVVSSAPCSQAVYVFLVGERPSFTTTWNDG